MSGPTAHHPAAVPEFFDDPALIAPRQCVRENLCDGVFVLRSPQPLGPFGRCVGEWLERWAVQTPGAPAFGEPDAAAPGGWRMLSWAVLRRQVGSIAQA